MESCNEEGHLSFTEDGVGERQCFPAESISARVRQWFIVRLVEILRGAFSHHQFYVRLSSDARQAESEVSAKRRRKQCA